jgi:hypothetical protein
MAKGGDRDVKAKRFLNRVTHNGLQPKDNKGQVHKNVVVYGPTGRKLGKRR